MAHIILSIVSNIGVYAKERYNIHDKKEEILKELNEYLDISKYDLNEKEESFILNMKNNHFESNIHALLKELYPLVDCQEYYNSEEENEITIPSEDFNAKKIPLKLPLVKLKDTYESYNRLYVTYYDNNTFLLDDYLQYYFFKKREFVDNINMVLVCNQIWFDIDNVDFENKDSFMMILNKLLQNYCQKPLAKNMMFFVA